MEPAVEMGKKVRPSLHCGMPERSRHKTVPRLFFSANFSAFSLLGVSQAASNAKQLSQKLLTEKLFYDSSSQA